MINFKVEKSALKKCVQNSLCKWWAEFASYACRIFSLWCRILTTLIMPCVPKSYSLSQLNN